MVLVVLRGHPDSSGEQVLHQASLEYGELGSRSFSSFGGSGILYDFNMVQSVLIAAPALPAQSRIVVMKKLMQETRIKQWSRRDISEILIDTSANLQSSGHSSCLALTDHGDNHRPRWQQFNRALS
jgi:hypothetical protein